MLDFIFKKLRFAGEDSLHFFATPGHKASGADEPDVLLELWDYHFGYLFDESIAVRRQLWTDIERILIDNHSLLLKSDLKDIRVELYPLAVRWFGDGPRLLSGQQLKTKSALLHCFLIIIHSLKSKYSLKATVYSTTSTKTLQVFTRPYRVPCSRNPFNFCSKIYPLFLAC